MARPARNASCQPPWLALFLLAGWVLTPSSVVAQSQAAALPPAVVQLLDASYAGYSASQACWIAYDAEQRRFCMTPARVDHLEAGDSQRTYVLLSGRRVDEDNEDNAAHADSGLVGAFVIEDGDDTPHVLAGNPAMPTGTMGAAPTDWDWLALGPDNYWGWTTTWGDCHQGYCGAHMDILAPYGKTIRNLGGFAVASDNSGACADADCEARTRTLEADVHVNTERTGARVFPLIVTVRGNRGLQPITDDKTVFEFDAHSWKYQVPEGWILEDADF